MIFLGCDPDMHDCAFAAVDEDSTLLWVCIAKLKGGKGREAIVDMIPKIDKALTTYYFEETDYLNVAAAAVESQDITYSARSGVNPNALLLLANISGAALMALHERQIHTLYLPKPQEWKGSIPKHIHQARTLSKVGLQSEKMGGKTPYCIPIDTTSIEGADQLNKGDWKHITDAVGLALWAKDKYLKQQKRIDRVA